MTSFLYFIPGHTSDMISAEQVKAAGLAYVLDKFASEVTCNALRAGGPDGQVGAIITDPRRINAGRNQLNPAEQTWVKNEASGVWVGMWNAQPPGPDDLARKKMLDGEKLELGDQQEWLIPYGRRFAASDDPEHWADAICTLPCRLGFGGGRDVFLRKPLPMYARLWSICEADSNRAAGAGSEADESLVGGVGAVFSAVEILRANYAVGTAEIELLGLFTQSTPREILDIFGDWATWREISEKKTRERADLQSSSSGPEVTSPGTDQP